ncbi:MAG: hypothetical protein LBF40_03475 [Deltaproteobacteria bacterium]|nr:hypothetical protein [Deltaproteobacteria bacterium]
MAAKKEKETKKAPKGKKAKSSAEKKALAKQQELETLATYYTVFRELFGEFVVNRSFGQLGLTNDEPRWENVIIEELIKIDYPSEIDPSFRADCLYRVVLKEGMEAPPRYVPGMLNLILVQYYEEEEPEDEAAFRKSIVRAMHTKYNQPVSFQVFVVFGPG